MTNLPKKRLAIVVSAFNRTITDRLLQGAENRLQTLSFPVAHYDVFYVPGAVEIPLMAQWLAKTKKYEAIVALGAVIRGETSHYDYVCAQVSQGCQQVSLANNLPVIFGVLTTETTAQAWARADGSHCDKGAESIDAALQMCALHQSLSLHKCQLVGQSHVMSN